MTVSTFGSRLLAFYEGLERFRWATPDVALLSPIADHSRHAAVEQFCAKYYGDDNRRVYWLGINPSRVRRTSTGVPYTDGFALEDFCGIANDFDKNRELTSDFFYRFVATYGGSEEFYRRNYAGAAFPLSILRKDKYCNYYEPDLPAEIADSIPSLLVQQAGIGHAGVLVIIGSGENAKVLSKLNEELGIFSHVYVVEHPRYIMQYKSSELDRYISKYCEVASEAERSGGLRS